MDRKRKRTLSDQLQLQAATVGQSTQSSAPPAVRRETLMSRSEPECPDSSDRYTVGWICALEEEYECACRMLDEEFIGPKTDDKDDNTYIYGRIAKHYVVIGCLPAGRYGTNSAARVARDMIRSFPHLRFALMVGIGGGAPTENNNIRLGDVVVSQPRDGFGGVIQYDMGKLQNSRFRQTGQLNAPPEKLLGVIPEIRRLYNDKRKPDRIAEHLQRMDDMDDYQRPMLDKLYRTEYQHVGEKNCGQCDPNQIVERPEHRAHRTVAVHYGTIASGNTVMKDATLRDAYAKDPELNILCFEMEAAGLMNNLPCLVIRGICDYCDSHKNDKWHKYAALTAAAYARELLLVLKSHRVQAMPLWAEQIASELRQVQQDMTTIINNQSAVQSRVDTIDWKIDWANLPSVKGAAFDSYDGQHTECLPGTRTELLHEVDEWTKSAQGKCVFWLNGMAGTGKSTICRTMASRLKAQNLLGASFFFKRGEGDRGNARNLFPTLIKQLVTSIPQLMPSIHKAIEDDPNISEKMLREQFEKLILQPLLGIKNRQTAAIVIVIDALDECEQEDDIRIILQLLPQVQKSNSVQLRFLLTSRPYLPLKLGFKGIMDDRQDLILHEIPRPVIEHDISLYIKDKFSQLRLERSLPLDWPGDETIKTLVHRTVPLFISAATLFRFISDTRWNPETRLEAILADQAAYVSRMDSTYMPVLNQLLTGQDEWESQLLVQEFKEIVGVIILLADPLSVKALAQLLNMRISDVSNRLDLLHSVLDIPTRLDAPVRLLHLSFRDFLLDPKKKDSSRFWIDDKATHRKIAIRCLEIMYCTLKKNICNLPDEGTQRAEVDAHSINRYLPSELQYACRYWAQHLAQSEDPFTELDNALPFLEKHFLHWVEALSILGAVSDVVGTIDTLQFIVPDTNSKIAEFLHDARRFVLRYRQLAHDSPLQLYCSGLVFTPKNSVIRRIFIEELSSRICGLPKVEESWSAELQTLEGHSGAVMSVAFSPDGRLLASGSGDETIKLWNTATGALQQTLESHSSSVESVAFSPDSQLLASGSNNGTIKLWNTITGALQQTLKGHSSLVKSVAFSLDGQLLASGSYDATIKLWNINTRALKQTLEGHSSSVESVAFSPDGRLLASGSSDETIKLWDTATETLQQTFNSHSYWVQSVVFSPESRLLALGSGDGLIKLWNTATGALQQTLEGHLHQVQSVAFSPDGRLLASGAGDETIKLWDTATGALKQTLEGHSSSVESVAFSPDGRLLASSSRDRTIKLWDTAPKTLQQTLNSHSSWVQSVIISPDGQLLASRSYNRTIKLWNTTTETLQQTLNSHSYWVQSVAFSPDSRLLASGSSDETIKLWDTATGALQQTLKGHSSSVKLVAFSLDGRLLASGSGDKTIKLWDTATGALQQTLKGHSSSVKSVAFSPDGRLLASSSDIDFTIKLWNTATGALQQTLEGHSDRVQSVAFSPDGRLLASGSDDETIRLWDTSIRALKQNFKGHSGAVRLVAFSPDGRLLASSSDIDLTIKLWDTATGALQQTLSIGGVVTNLKFSEDCPYLSTNLGFLNIKPWYNNHLSYLSKNNVEVFIREDQWVTLQGKRLLWLPTEYRPTTSAVKMDGTLILGHASGRISFIRVRA